MKSSDKQLLVETALAAANHRLERNALCILEVFPYLITDEEDRQICESLIYFALDKKFQAIRVLNDLHTPKVEGIRFFYQSSLENIDTKKICSLITGGHDGN